MRLSRRARRELWFQLAYALALCFLAFYNPGGA